MQNSMHKMKKSEIQLFNREKMLTIFGWNFEIQERCKVVHCVDFGESFQTHINLQHLASIQPRTSPVKFARSSGTSRGLPEVPRLRRAEGRAQTSRRRGRLVESPASPAFPTSQSSSALSKRNFAREASFFNMLKAPNNLGELSGEISNILQTFSLFQKRSVLIFLDISKDTCANLLRIFAIQTPCRNLLGHFCPYFEYY